MGNAIMCIPFLFGLFAKYILGLGKIFFRHSVVGDDTYSIYTKLGGRTSLFLTSQRMPSRYNAYINKYN